MAQVVGRALMLASRGLPVFPCNSNKKPTPDHGCLEASTDPDVIRSMWMERPGPLIGVATGTKSGIDALDIDPRNGGAEWYSANHDRIPVTLRHATRSGGEHCIFKHHPDVRNRASKIAEGVDVRGEGGYVIWWPAMGFDVVQKAEPCDWPEWILEKIKTAPPPEATPQASRRPAEANGNYAMTALMRECDNIRFAPDGGKHDALNKAAYSIGGLVAGGALFDGLAIAAMNASLQDIRARCKDFRAAERTLREAYEAGKQKARHVEETVYERAEISDDWAPLLAKLDGSADDEPEEQTEPDDDLPTTEIERILKVDGFLGAFVDFTTRTATRPQPLVALSAAISLVGALAGRRYRSDRNLRTNVYTVSVLDSGGGKEHARQVISRLCAAAKLDQYQGGGDIASASALRTSLHAHPARVYMLDEFGDFMGSMLGRKASQHKADVARLLKELYTSAGGKLLGTEYADDKQKPRKDVWEPCACIYGTSTPAQFWNAIAGASLADGLMARFLVFVPDDDYPAVQSPPFEDIPDALIDMAKAITKGSEAHDPPNLANIVRSDAPGAPYTVPLALHARGEFEAIQAVQEGLLHRHRGTHVTSLASRIVENAIKLAMISAISRSPRSPIIERRDMEWGAALALYCYQTMRDGADRYSAENDNQARVKMVLECLRKLKDKTSTNLCRTLKGKLSATERNGAIQDLKDAGLIVEEQLKSGTKGGRPVTKYRVL